ncbi:MAG: hypothetical protein JJT90_18885 [Ectothiorhodospiraceae bacterium]|nr:hypothetical protein [Ectothiorhodospiraceae bacterium]
MKNKDSSPFIVRSRFRDFVLASGLAMVLAIVWPGTAVFAQEGPDADVLAQHLIMDLPPYWSVQSVSIIAEVNDGDAVDPKIRQRFEAMVSPRADLFVTAPGDLDLPPPHIRARPTLASGAERVLYGTTRAEMAAGRWRLAIVLENDVSDLGQPLDMFREPAVVQGSEEEQAIITAARDDLLANVIAELESRMERLQRTHEAEIEEATARHEQQLAAQQRRFEEELGRIEQEQADSLEAMRAAFERRLALIVQEFEEEAAILRAEAEAAAELTRLEQERAQRRAELAEARAQARASETARLSADMDTVTQGLRDENPVTRHAALLAVVNGDDEMLRNHAIEMMLFSDDTEMRKTAILAGLEAPSASVRSAAIGAALASDDAGLRLLAAIDVLANRSSLSLPQADESGPVLVVSDIEIDRETGALTAQLSGDGNFSRCAPGGTASGALTLGGLDLTNERCTLNLSMGVDGAITGVFVAQNRYRHEVGGRLL